LTARKHAHYDAPDRTRAGAHKMKRTKFLLIALVLTLAITRHAAAQDAAAPIRRGVTPTPAEQSATPTPTATEQPATPAPTPAQVETPAPTPIATPTPAEPAATPAKAAPAEKTSTPAAATAPGNRVLQEKPVRAMERRPGSVPKPDVESAPEPRPTGPSAWKPTFDLSESSGGYVGATIRALENKWQAALAKHDVDAIDALIADDFIGMSSTGKLGSKSTMLDALKRDKNTYTSAKARGLIVRAFGANVAVVTGTARESGTTAEGRAFSSGTRFTDTWMQRDGKWQCIASHATQLPKD
jgi:ketosteroid isomerase-like protein